MKKNVYFTFFLFSIICLNNFADNQKELLKKIPADNSKESLSVGRQPPGTSCFTIKNDLIFVPDIYRKRFVIFDLDLNFIKEIKCKSEEDYLLSAQRIEILKDKILIISNYIVTYDMDGRIQSNIKYNTNEHWKFFIIDDFLYYYTMNNDIEGISENGDILPEKEAITRLVKGGGWQKGVFNKYNEIKDNVLDFLNKNKILFYNDKLYSWAYDKYHKRYFDLLRKAINVNNVPNDKDYLLLIGFDKHNNSYWMVQDRNYYANNNLCILDNTGKIIKCLDGVLTRCGPGNVQITDNGDIYILLIFDISKYTAFYRIKNTWDPIDASLKTDASTKTTDAVKSIPSVAFATKATSLTATSFIDYQSMYTPYRVFDGDPKTAWLEAAKGSGIDEAITLALDKEITVDEIRFMPGYFDKQWWNANNRIRKLTAESGGKVLTFTFDDAMYEQGLKLTEPITFTKIRFSIKEVYRSTGDDDTALSEISFYNAGKKVELDMSGVK